MKDSNFSPKEPMVVADYENVKKSAFDWLAATFSLKESTILWNIFTFEWRNEFG